MFYSISQNNSGGSFIQDDNVDQIVIIEADTAKEAEEYLDDLVNMNGYNDNSCPCCGDNFYVGFYEGDASDHPKTPYGEDLIVSKLEGFSAYYSRFAVIHYKNGQKKRYDRLENTWMEI